VIITKYSVGSCLGVQRRSGTSSRSRRAAACRLGRRRANDGKVNARTHQRASIYERTLIFKNKRSMSTIDHCDEIFTAL